MRQSTFLFLLVICVLQAICYAFVPNHPQQQIRSTALSVAIPIEQQEELEQKAQIQKTRKLRKEKLQKERDSGALKLKKKLLKQLKAVAKDYEMLQDGDHIMVCVSGGKDSAALLVLLMHLQEQFRPIGVDFKLTAVHVDQKQPGEFYVDE